MRTIRFCWALGLAGFLLFAAVGPSLAEEGTITFPSLLDEMVDREASARFPSPAYTCRQASSYDRASVSADDQESWMANNDRSFFIRSEQNGGREEWVMMEAAGPGCVVRFWATSGNPTGNVRVYVDGQDEPVINQPVKGLVGGDALVGPPLSEVRARGMNLYLPIPYAKSCKITYDRPNFHVSGNGDDLLYYQINYRTYEAGAKVESFGSQTLAAAQEKLAEVQEALLAPAAKIDGQVLSPASATLEPNPSPKSGLRLSIDGSQAIRRLTVRLEAEDMAAATRSTVLRMEFDGEQTVWCPIGDFFGSGVGVNPYTGWWRTVEEDGRMTCYWVMPFEKSCEIRIENLGEQAVKVQCQPTLGPWSWDDRSMHFRTNWRQEFPIDTSVKHDWNYLVARGQGVYMGDTLALTNPVQVWWGEGDEKIYVDGETFPSHFGTGTEDYYGYAWCTPAFFQSPFHSQPLAEGPGNQGRVTNTRVRLLDGIPFTTDFRFDMEVWHWRPCEVSYAVATYWYALPGASGNHGPAPEMARLLEPEMPVPRKVAGAIEGEALEILEKTGGTTEIQSVDRFHWSGAEQLWWKDGKPGDRLVLALPVAETGKYTLKADLTKAIDYAIAQFSLDGAPLGEPIDFINNGVINEVFTLGVVELAAGDHKLTIELTGANEKAVKRYMIGVDYLLLEPVE